MDTHERGYRTPDDGEVGPVVFETGDPPPNAQPVAVNVSGPGPDDVPLTDAQKAELADEAGAEPPAPLEEPAKAPAAKKATGNS